MYVYCLCAGRRASVCSHLTWISCALLGDGAVYGLDAAGHSLPLRGAAGRGMAGVAN